MVHVSTSRPKQFFSLVSWGGVWLIPLGMSTTNWAIVRAPDDRRRVWNSRWNENWQGKLKYSKKTCTSTTLSTTNPTWFDLGSNPDRRGGKPETYCLSYSTALDPNSTSKNLNVQIGLFLHNWRISHLWVGNLVVVDDCSNNRAVDVGLFLRRSSIVRK
jgi:hypothetical protein